VTTATFEPLPFEGELELRAPSLDELGLPEPALRLPDEAELPLRDEAAEERRLEAPALLGLLREAEDLLLDDPLRLLFEDPLRLLLLEPLWLFGLDPFELREFVCLLFEERVLPWAMAPP
jgi:hypothetical protein